MKTASVILAPKGDKRTGKNIAAEPEMQELKRMIRAGELNRNRTRHHVREGIHEKDPSEA